MSLFPLNTVLFPREQFGSKQTALHHYIAHRNKANFDTWLGKVKDKFPELLDARDPNYGLTPLAVAVMAKDLTKAKALHAAGASLETRDCRRCTLLHWQQHSSKKTPLK